MAVGFPNLNPLMRRRTVRAPVNPMDKATIFSIFPKKIVERKITIQPGIFIIEAGSVEKPTALTVGPSSWWREVDEESPLLEIPNSALQVADAVVKDYCNSMLGYEASSRGPGLFYIPGEITLDALKKDHAQVFNNAVARQRNWFLALVSIGDTLWAKSNGNPLVISDEMRMAARNLGLNQKDWMKDFAMVQNVACVACGMPRNPAFPVCPNCKAVTDPKKAEELGIVFAVTK